MDDLSRIAGNDQRQAAQRDARIASWDRGQDDAAQTAGYLRYLLAQQVPMQIAMQLTNSYVLTVVRDRATREQGR